MKNVFPIIILVSLLSFSANAQKDKWKEMEDFHSIMSETFHPAEEGKLGPIKNRSKEMAEKAVAWLQSTAPAGYDKKAVKTHLKKLAKDSKKLNKLVKSGAADEMIKEKLAALHDTFHTIMEECEK